MTSASTVLQDEVPPADSEEEKSAESNDDEGDEREKSLDDIIDAYAK